MSPVLFASCYVPLLPTYISCHSILLPLVSVLLFVVPVFAIAVLGKLPSSDWSSVLLWNGTTIFLDYTETAP